MLAFDTETQQVYTDSFDGPLELLLYLVRRQGVDIRTVQIASITDSYLHHVRQMSELRLDIAGDFLYLASTLCYLKSRELLPNFRRDDLVEEEEDPMVIRERLAQQLIEYERYREASQFLHQRPLLNRDVFTKAPDEQESTPSATTDVNALELLQLYRKILEQYQKPAPEHYVAKTSFSLYDMGEWIFDQLETGVSHVSVLLQQFTDKANKICCFLTLLELGKHQFVEIFQQEHLGEIAIYSSYEQRPPLELLFEGQHE